MNAPGMEECEDEEVKTETEHSDFFYLDKGNNAKLVKDALTSRGYKQLDHGMKFNDGYRLRWV